MTDGDSVGRGKTAHLSPLCRADGGLKLSSSFAPLLTLLLHAQLNYRTLQMSTVGMHC